MSASARRNDHTSSRRPGTLFITAATLIVTILTALTACSSGDVRMEEGDSGGQATVASGGTLEIALDSDPGSGYVWLVSAVDTAVLAQAGESSFEPESDEEGAEGVETFYFEGVGRGSTPLVLEYVRPAELEGAERTFEVEVTVE